MRVIYLCSTEGKRLADGCKPHHLPAFVLPVLLPERGSGSWSYAVLSFAKV